MVAKHHGAAGIHIKVVMINNLITRKLSPAFRVMALFSLSPVKIVISTTFYHYGARGAVTRD